MPSLLGQHICLLAYAPAERSEHPFTKLIPRIPEIPRSRPLGLHKNCADEAQRPPWFIAHPLVRTTGHRPLEMDAGVSRRGTATNSKHGFAPSLATKH